MKSFRYLIFFFIAAIGLYAGCQQSMTKTAKSEVELGEELYTSYCKICHGDEGDGPMVKLLKVPAPDLTYIQARWDGVFPDTFVYNVIEGKERLAQGHGDSDMPIWGEALLKAENITEAELPEKINQLVAFIKSKQQGYY